MVKQLLQSLAIFGCLACAPAFATSITIDDTSTNNETAVSGILNFDVLSAGGDTYVLSMSIDNTSNTGIGGSSFDGVMMTGFAIDVLGDITGSTTAAGWDSQIDGTATLPGEALSFDACFYSGANCGAGGNGGLLADAGLLGGFSLTLSLGGTDTATLTNDLLAGFESGDLSACMRFIRIPESGAGSGNGAGSDVACYGGGGGPVGTPTPEPGTMFLMGSGLAGLGFWRWKKGTKTQA